MRTKYSTAQNWYPGDAEGHGGILNFVTKRGDCRGARSKISWTLEPPENTAELSVAKKLSEIGTTVPRYFFTSRGCFCSASEIGMNSTPALASSCWKVVATETESNTASTATRGLPSGRSTPAKISCSRSGIPSFS